MFLSLASKVLQAMTNEELDNLENLIAVEKKTRLCSQLRAEEILLLNDDLNNKITVMKMVRSGTGFGLKEVKEIVDAWQEKNPRKS